MNTYQIEVAGLTHVPYQTIAETPSKAKYECFKYFTDELNYDLSFKEFVISLEYCRKIGGFKPKDLFGDKDMFNRMKESRDIDFAYMGMRIEVCGKMGTIVGSNSSMNLDVCFDNTHWTDNCHPGYMARYFDDKGNVLMDNTKPDENKCVECQGFDRCKVLLGRDKSSIGCDFSPTKFIAKFTVGVKK